MVKFEQNQLVVESLWTFLFRKKIKIPYQKIERIEAPVGENVVFYMKNGKVIKVPDPGIVVFYTQFGEMLRKYGIHYLSKTEDSGEESIERVREKAAQTKKLALTYADQAVKERLGAEYGFDAKIVERVIGTTLEFRLLKEGVVQESANFDESIDGEPLTDEMHIAYLYEWDPVSDSGKYVLAEEAINASACEKYIEELVLKQVLNDE